MRKLLITLLLILLASTVWGADETIRPTGAYTTTGSIWANPANSYDNSLTTYSGGAPGNDDVLYVGATTTIATDAWETPSATYTSATLSCVAEYVRNAAGNDTLAVEVRNGADTIVATLHAASTVAFTKTTYTWDLTSGYLSDPTDLRCVYSFERVGGGDDVVVYAYEVWIDGTYAGGRQRMINMTQNEEVQDEKSHGSTGPVVAVVRSNSVRRNNAH